MALSGRASTGKVGTAAALGFYANSWPRPSWIRLGEEQDWLQATTATLTELGLQAMRSTAWCRGHKKKLERPFYRFLFGLCRELGVVHPNRLAAQMTAEELFEWWTLYRTKPGGIPARTYARGARVPESGG